MAKPKPFKNIRRVLTIWAAIIAAAFLLSEVFTVSLAVYAGHVRESDYRTYVAEATKLIEEGNLSGALLEIDEALKRAPEAPEPYVVAGHIHYRMKKWDQAIAAYQNAIDRGDADTGVRLNIAWALIELERYVEAIAFGREQMAAGMDSPNMARYVAEAYSRSDRLADAVPYFEQALEGHPNDLYLLDHLKQAYQKAGRKEDAEAVRTRIADVETSLNAIATQ